jgi:ComF family protein
MSGLISSLKEFLFPRHCIVCRNRLGEEEEHICFTCLRRLPRFGKWKPGNQMEHHLEGLLRINRAAAWFTYRHESDYRRLLMKMKYFGHPEVGEYLGRCTAQELLPTGFFDGIDVLVPVPLAKERQRERGYNQSEWIVKGLASVTGIAVRTDAVVRTVSNESQTHKSREERAANVQGIFALQNASGLAGHHVLLVDDVMTTGATLAACAAPLTTVEGLTLSMLTVALASS